MDGASGEASPNTDPPQPPATEPAAAGASPPLTDPEPSPAPAPEEERLNITPAQLADRMRRSNSSHVRGIGSDFGLENEDQMRVVFERDRAAQAKAETDRQASLTREQALQEQLEASQASQAQAEEAAEHAEFQALIHSSCSRMGIRNTAYAEHMVLDAAARSTDEEFDEQAFLQRLMEDPAQAAALGTVATESTGATTVPGEGHDDPPPANPPRPPGATDAMSMTKDEYRKYRATLGGSGGSSIFG